MVWNIYKATRDCFKHNKRATRYMFPLRHPDGFKQWLTMGTSLLVNYVESAGVKYIRTAFSYPMAQLNDLLIHRGEAVTS